MPYSVRMSDLFKDIWHGIQCIWLSCLTCLHGCSHKLKWECSASCRLSRCKVNSIVRSVNRPCAINVRYEIILTISSFISIQTSRRAQSPNRIHSIAFKCTPVDHISRCPAGDGNFTFVAFHSSGHVFEKRFSSGRKNEKGRQIQHHCTHESRTVPTLRFEPIKILFKSPRCQPLLEQRVGEGFSHWNAPNCPEQNFSPSIGRNIPTWMCHFNAKTCRTFCSVAKKVEKTMEL